MRKLVSGLKKAALAVGAVVAATTVASAQITGTNAVTVLSDNANNASSVFYVIMIGLIGTCLAVGVGKKLLAKGGARA